MLMALLLVLILTVSGLALTYLYDPDSPFLTRLAIGFVTGMTAQGLVAFTLALHFGLTLGVIAVSALPFLSPLLIFSSAGVRASLLADVRRLLHFRGRSRYRFSHLMFSLLLIAMLMWVFHGVLYEEKGAIFTANHHNYGDLPWHIALVRGFTVGGNYPPEHLQFAGSRLTYPYLHDFITAEFDICGANLVQSFLLSNLCLAVCLLCLLQQWAFRLTRSPFILITAPLLFFFSGGWGWLMLFQDIPRAGKSLGGFLLSLPHDYTRLDPWYSWGNSITVLLTTQRSILLGIPIALAAMIQLHGALKFPDQRRNRLLAAGCICGLLPLSHTHTGLVMLSVTGCYMLPEFWRRDPRWRDYLYFFVPALVLMAPQGLMLLTGTDAHTSHYFGISIGWDCHDENPLIFWLRNTGPFFPLLAIALFWKGTKPLLSPLTYRVYLPFVLWWILPNVFKFAPWIWDNIKVLIYGYLASIPIVLLVLARLWQQKGWPRATALSLLVMMTLAGGLDVFRIATGQFRQQVYSPEDIAFGEGVNQSVPPGCRILHAPIHNHAVTLAGRRLLCGYSGHLWSHGFDFADRAADVLRIYAGADDADHLLEKYKIDYIVDGPPEHRSPGYDADVTKGLVVNDAYLSKFPVVVHTEHYRLLRVH